MELFFLAVVCLLAGAIGPAILRSAELARAFSCVAIFLGSVLGFVSSLVMAIGHQTITVSLPWGLPIGSGLIKVDPLSSFFLCVVFLLSGAASVYAMEYLKERKGVGARVHFCFFAVFVTSMVFVVVAANIILFLIAWEIMSISSLFLVGLDHEDPKNRRASRMYFWASQIGAAAILSSFILLANGSSDLNFTELSASGTRALLVFILAFIGFGCKAGIVPFHVWLPEAHPAAPSHISALMSGVMIKLGIYGILRIMTLVTLPWESIGVGLIILGSISGVLGVLFALAQHDLKRLLAYSSVENVGIIFIGLGIGCLGKGTGMPALAVLGFGGALFHVLNHAIFKGLLFLSAGAVIRITKLHDIEQLGGLLKSAPWTGFTFLIAAAAICGLPPFNGFTSEYLLFRGSFEGMIPADGKSLMFCLAVLALALMGGLALACFTKAFGIVFLGEPRHPIVVEEVGWPMRLSMAFLALLCFVCGIGAFSIWSVIEPIAQQLALGGVLHEGASDIQIPTMTTLFFVGYAVVGFLIFGIIALIGIFRYFLLNERTAAFRPITRGPTWDCGYVAPSARMQYSASSFAEPTIRFFSPLVRITRKEKSVRGYFPENAHIHTHHRDSFEQYIFAPLFSAVNRFCNWLHWLHPTRLHFFPLYIIGTLLLLIIWNFGVLP